MRCSRCEHTWFQDVGEPDAPEAYAKAPEAYESLFEEFEAEPRSMVGTEPEPGEGYGLDDQARHVAREKIPEESNRVDEALYEPDGRTNMKMRDEFDDFDAGPEPTLDINPVARKRRRFSRAPKDDAPKFDERSDRDPSERGFGSRLVSGLISLFGTIAVLGAIGAGVWVFRPQIVELVPQAEVLYALLPVEEPPADYDLRNTGYIEASEEGQHVLIVSGEVVNQTDKPLPVPVVQVTVSTIDGKQLAQWSFKPRGGPIGAGQSRYFETRRLNPPEGSQKLRIIVLEQN